MAASNSNRLLLIGVLVFVVGVVLVLLVFWGLNSDDEPTTLVTEGPTGSSQAQPQPTFTGPLRLLPVPVEVPSNMEGVAVRLGNVRGLASVPLPGDLVNIYRLQDVEDPPPGDPADPLSAPDLPASATLFLESIEVLGNAGTPGSNEEVTFIIAVERADVAALLPLIEAQQVWFTLLPVPEESATAGAPS